MNAAYPVPMDNPEPAGPQGKKLENLWRSDQRRQHSIKTNMLQLTLTISEEARGVCIYHQLMSEAPTVAENLKLNMILAGIGEAVEAEAKRLDSTGCGQTMAGPDAPSMIGLKEGPVNTKTGSKEPELRAALTEILNLGQETCATHEDQCIAATLIAQRALTKP